MTFAHSICLLFLSILGYLFCLIFVFSLSFGFEALIAHVSKMDAMWQYNNHGASTLINSNADDENDLESNNGRERQGSDSKGTSSVSLHQVKYSNAQQWIRAFLYGVRVFAALLSMVLFMTMEIGIILALITGHILGFQLFARTKVGTNDDSNGIARAGCH